jgi:hypothetical protein
MISVAPPGPRPVPGGSIATGSGAITVLMRKKAAAE